MADGTRLDLGSGGDLIVDKDCTANDGLPAGKVPVSALVLLTGGGKNVPVNVDANAPLPVTAVITGTPAVNVSNFPTTQAVSGSVAATQSGSWTTVVSNFPTTQAVSGTVSATQSGVWTVAVSSLPAITFSAPQHVIVDSATLGTVTISGAVTLASTTITGTVAVTQSGTWNVGFSAPQHVIIDSATLGTVTVTGSVTTSGTATVSGTVAVSSIGGTLPAFASPPAVTVSGNVAITAAALPLPSGAATSALQGGGLPAGLGAHGGLVIEGVASGVAVPTSLATLPALTTGSATIGAVTGPSAVALAKDSTLTDATQRAGILGTNGSAIAGATNPIDVRPSADGTNPVDATHGLYVRPGTSTLWDIIDRAARLIGAITGKDGSTVASASNGVPVAPETSSVWDVKDRAARLLGALTGANGSSVATAANPVPTASYDGNGALSGLVAGWLVNANVGSALPAAGLVVKNGPGVFGGIGAINGTGSGGFLQIHNLAAATGYTAATLVNVSPGSITSGSNTLTNATTGGIQCTVGIVAVWSSTQYTYTSVGSNTGAVIALYR